MLNEWGLTNWPPATMPVWTGPSFSDWRELAFYIQSGQYESGWSIDFTPTGAERNQYFKDALDGDGHSVRGIIVVAPNGIRYPFAVCTDLTHLELLVPFVPYSMGTLAGAGT